MARVGVLLLLLGQLQQPSFRFLREVPAATTTTKSNSNTTSCAPCCHGVCCCKCECVVLTTSVAVTAVQGRRLPVARVMGSGLLWPCGKQRS